ncbi:MAG: 2-hydroxyacid dehydrogenase [Pirellulaceae bacterium]|jgi:D-lactate dehydrogenase|nr:2-hydroxyacid dehydrogenase [Pirellulaceae bacterium]
MQDQARLQSLIERLKLLPGLDARTFDRVLLELDQAGAGGAPDPSGPVRVTVFDTKARDVEFLDAANAGRCVFHYVRAALSRDTAHAATNSKVVCVFVNDECSADVLEQLAALGVELIALRCAGFNHVDMDACRRLNLDVVRVPAYSPYAVAEFTVALMMTLNRRLHHAYQRNRSGNFVLDGLMGFDMHGKIAGVIGTGQIGRCTIDILRGFGCRILAVDKYPDKQLLACPDVQYVDQDVLLRESDIVTLHVPLFPETYHLINQGAIERMKPGVMLINTSRGGLVDTRALIAGLKSGKIGSAGLDVYEEEAGIFFHDMSDKVLTDDVLARLMTFNNVVVTSHQAFLTREAMANIADTTLANIAEYVAGRRGAELTHAIRRT